MSDKMQDDIMKLYDYVEEVAAINPDFGIDSFFKIKDDLKRECFIIIDKIHDLNKKIPLEVDRSKKGKMSLEKGLLLEELACKILNSHNIYSDKKNLKCDSNEIDVLFKPATLNGLFSSLLPNFMKTDIIVECKNYKDKIDVTWTGKVYSLLRYKGVKAGIIFSFYGLKGDKEWDAARGLVKKFFLKDETVIINITMQEIIDLLNNDNSNIVRLIKSKLDNLKYHTDFSDYISSHPAEQESVLN